jgi:PAS domain S-box-containing protein
MSRQVLHQPEPGPDGHLDPVQVLEINSDVTAARAAEIALADSEQRLRAQFDNSAAGQVIRALDGTLTAVNRAYAGMLGHTADELTGRPEAELLDPAEVEENRHLLAGLFAGDADSYTREGRLRHADGHRVDVEATVSLVRDDTGRPKHLIGVVTDISGRRAAERARDNAAASLAERNTELEAANQLKLDIIGMLGHEIGNPLTTIQGQAEILADDWARLDDSRRGRAIDAIGRQAARLDDIVREVLAMVTIDAGSIRADRRELSVRSQIDSALASFLTPEPLPVHGDDAQVLFAPGHLQQILVNLLSNAAKYGGGATAVRIARSDGWVHVTVEDSGPGVPEQFRDRLFDRLTRAERDATTVKGTGLGLYIVRGLARANHGDVHHEPNPAGGSRFILDLEATT